MMDTELIKKVAEMENQYLLGEFLSVRDRIMGKMERGEDSKKLMAYEDVLVEEVWRRMEGGEK